MYRSLRSIHLFFAQLNPQYPVVYNAFNSARPSKVCIKPMSSQCWCMDQKRALLQRLLLGDWMPLTHGLSEKSCGSRILDTFLMLLSGRLPAALQFQVSLKQEGSISLDMWHIQIPDKIITELSMRCLDHQKTGGDLEGACVPTGCEGLMPMYSRQTSVSTQLGGRPMIVFFGDASLTWQHSIRGMPMKKRQQSGYLNHSSESGTK